MLFHLSHLAVLKLEGAGAANFLQGQLTADIRQVTKTHYQPATLCNLQGRVISLIDVLKWHEQLYLILPKDLLEKVISVLDKPAKFSRVQLVHEKEYDVMGYWHANEDAAEFELPSTSQGCLGVENYFIGCISPSFYFIILNKSFAEKFPANQNTQLWHEAQLRKGEFEIYSTTSEQFLPHRLNLQETPRLSFDKGCYRGQEIIARTHYRATLKHRLVQYEVESETILQPGMEIFDEMGHALGELVDVCLIAEQRYLISASLRLEHPNQVRFASSTQEVTLYPLT